MFMNPLHRQRGVTLVELMVGLTVGLIVIGVVGSLFLTTMGGSNDSLRSMKLNQELRTALDYMAADIRRAGYWSAAAAANNPAANPYMVRTGTATDVFVGNGCIRYSYDRDDDGTIPRFGFRLQGGALQVPQSTALGAANGTNDNCNEGAWEALTDPNTVVIDELTFSTEGSQCRNLNQTTGTPPAPVTWEAPDGSTTPACADTTATGYAAPTAGDQLVETRQITIRLVGHHARDANTTLAIEESIRLPNNRVLSAP